MVSVSSLNEGFSLTPEVARQREFWGLSAEQRRLERERCQKNLLAILSQRALHLTRSSAPLQSPVNMSAPPNSGTDSTVNSEGNSSLDSTGNSSDTSAAGKGS